MMLRMLGVVADPAEDAPGPSAHLSWRTRPGSHAIAFKSVTWLRGSFPPRSGSEAPAAIPEGSRRDRYQSDGWISIVKVAPVGLPAV